jgi:hypothetical protein
VASDDRPLWVAALNEPLRRALMEQARIGKPTTYRELADRLGLKPPHTIHRVAEALEALMEEDIAAGRPMLSALCASKARTGLPGPGFFLKAQSLGAFSGDPEGPEAGAFHQRELRCAFLFYATPTPSGNQAT